jgi:hypothetical protein
VTNTLHLADEENGEMEDRTTPTNAHWVLPIAISLAINAIGVVFGLGATTNRLEAVDHRLAAIESTEGQKVDQRQFDKMQNDIDWIRNYLMEHPQPQKK